MQSFNSRAHGGRDAPGSPTSCGVMFQFTRPRGARRRDRRRGHEAVGVSIHAPTGGATLRPRRAFGGDAFQFTRPRGARLEATRRRSRSGMRFNSRAHGGRDSCRAGIRPGRPRFNSRAHGGRDCIFFHFFFGRRVSIHAPTGGATPPMLNHLHRDLFQFTRPRGARRDIMIQ